MQDLHRIGGLDPEVWICVGPGYSREEIKDALFERGISFVAEAATNPTELCSRIIGIKKTQVLSTHSRQEILRTLLSEPRILRHLGEIKQRRRKRGFWKKLDLAIQNGRLVFAHEQEQEVLASRLTERQGNQKAKWREEVIKAASAYESYLRASEIWDSPLLFRDAVERLASGTELSVELPQKIIWLQGRKLENLETRLIDELRHHCEVEVLGQDLVELPEEMPAFGFERWHTFDDAAEALGEEISRQGDLDNHIVLIPDRPEIRRSLNRGFEKYGVLQAETRDPTRLRTDERIKLAVLPLRLVALGFEKQDVLSFIRSQPQTAITLKWKREIEERGLIRGLKSFSGGNLGGLAEKLSEIASNFPRKLSIQEFADAHMSSLKSQETFRAIDSLWVIDFFEAFWKSSIEDLERVGLAEKPAPVSYWFQVFSRRLENATPPAELLRPETGVRVYRLQQFPVDSIMGSQENRPKVWILGLGANWLSEGRAGDYWFSDKERDVLSEEFNVRSRSAIYFERQNAIRSWSHIVSQFVFLDAHYNADGRERETLVRAIEEIFEISGQVVFENCGSRESRLKSYGPPVTYPAQKTQLPDLRESGELQIPATALDRYSRCGMQGLGGSRWRLRDLRESGADLWPDSKGRILHKAVELVLIDSKSDPETLRSALDRAWEIEKPQGLYRSKRLQKYVKEKLYGILKKFVEKEKVYRERSNALSISLEEKHQLDLDIEGAQIVGVSDRIDENENGIFIIDYKTTSSLPSGRDMVDDGYRLQLPFYALAAKQRYNKPVAGVQFVELNQRASRSRGIFFSPFNGKQEGALSQVRSNSLSLFSEDPEEVWQRCEDWVKDSASDYIAGKFEALPKKSTECRGCAYSDFCGRRRVVT